MGNIVSLPTSSTPPTLTPTIIPSSQQLDVEFWVQHGIGSALVEAVAGGGKTSTLINCCKHMLGSVVLAVFAKKNQLETVPKVKNLPNVKVGTFHSFGLKTLKVVWPDVQVTSDEFNKYRLMMKECKVPRPLQSAVGKMVSLAKQSVVCRLWDINDLEYWNRLIDHFDVLLRIDADEQTKQGLSDSKLRSLLISMASYCLGWSRSIGHQLVDFDDMLWLALVEEGMSFEQFDWFLGDEAQDTNPARLLMASLMIKPEGRMLWTGDRNQSIFGFTGADDKAIQFIVNKFDCQLLPLTVTFRCSKQATELAKTWVPHIEAHEDNNEGSVNEIRAAEFKYDFVLPAWKPGESGEDFDIYEWAAEVRTAKDTDDLLKPIPHLPLHPGDAILCRITKPLVDLAFNLIGQNVPCHVEGRKIGEGLDRLVSRWGVFTRGELLDKLEKYRTDETTRLLKKDRLAAIERLNDMVDTIVVVSAGCDTVDHIRRRLGILFRDTSSPFDITLSTIHKAKGREWSRVFILGFHEFQPSKWATQEWELQQEKNLMYVGVTRTRCDLFLVEAL